MKRLHDFKESFFEILFIIKICLTTFWFWLPALFAAYFYVQLWMIFFIHPLTILFVPIALSIFSITIEKRRTKIRYGLDKVKFLKAGDPLGAKPRWKSIKWEAEKAVREYEKSLGKNHEEKTKEES